MCIETDEDLSALKRIGRIVALVLREMGKTIAAGMTTAELDDVGRRALARHGATSAPEMLYEFPGATCISVNNESAHGVPGDRVIEPGDLVNIDVSAELDGFFADTGGSFPVAPITPQTQRLCFFTHRALKSSLAAVRSGRRFNRVGRAVEVEARRGGFNIIRNLAGHGVGRSLHEYPDGLVSYFNRDDDRRFTEGLVVAIEPFLSTGASEVHTGDDGWTQLTVDGSITAQYEHTVVVTRKKPIIVTQA